MSRTYAHVHRSKLDQSLPWPLFRKQFSRSETDYSDEWFGPLANKRPRKSRAKVSQTLHRIQAGLIDADDMVM